MCPGYRNIKQKGVRRQIKDSTNFLKWNANADIHRRHDLQKNIPEWRESDATSPGSLKAPSCSMEAFPRQIGRSRGKCDQCDVEAPYSLEAHFGSQSGLAGSCWEEQSDFGDLLLFSLEKKI